MIYQRFASISRVYFVAYITINFDFIVHRSSAGVSCNQTAETLIVLRCPVWLVLICAALSAADALLVFLEIRSV